MSTRPAPIRLSQDADAALGQLVDLLSKGQPIPPSRSETLRYAVWLALRYVEARDRNGKLPPTLSTLTG